MILLHCIKQEMISRNLLTVHTLMLIVLLLIVKGYALRPTSASSSSTPTPKSQSFYSNQQQFHRKVQYFDQRDMLDLVDDDIRLHL